MNAEEAKNELEKMKSDLEFTLPFLKIAIEKKKKLTKEFSPFPDILGIHYASIFEKIGAVLQTIQTDVMFSSTIICSRETINEAIEKYKLAFDIVLAIKQQIQFSNKKKAWKILEEFYYVVLSLERELTIENSLKFFDPKTVKYTENEVEAKFQKFNANIIRMRSNFYKHIDPDFKKLEEELTQIHSPEKLDLSFAKLLYLMGFDYEIYNRVQGDIDIIASDILNNVVLLIEATTGKINKKKVAQLTVRKAEYSKKENYSSSKPEIKLIIVSSSSELIDELAAKEASNNTVSIIGLTQLREVLKMMKNESLNQSKFLKYIEKFVPLSK